MSKTRNERRRLFLCQKIGAAMPVAASIYSLHMIGIHPANVIFLVAGLWLMFTKRLVVGY